MDTTNSVFWYSEFGTAENQMTDKNLSVYMAVTMGKRKAKKAFVRNGQKPYELHSRVCAAENWTDGPNNVDKCKPIRGKTLN